MLCLVVQETYRWSENEEKPEKAGEEVVFALDWPYWPQVLVDPYVLGLNIERFPRGDYDSDYGPEPGDTIYYYKLYQWPDGQEPKLLSNLLPYNPPNEDDYIPEISEEEICGTGPHPDGPCGVACPRNVRDPNKLTLADGTQVDWPTEPWYVELWRYWEGQGVDPMTITPPGSRTW